MNYNQPYWGQSLPRALTKEEEKYYLELHDKNNKEARNKLIEHNLRLVFHISHRFNNSGILLEDIASIGTIGLIKGIDTYQLDKNAKLATYISKCIINEILMYLRKHNKYQKHSIYDDTKNNPSFENILHNYIYKIDEVIEERETYNEIKKALQQLNDKDIELIKLRFGFYGEVKSQRDVASIFGCSQAQIWRIEKKLIKKLQKPFNPK